MNFAIGKELNKLAFKRAKGQGEFSYVSVSTGKEVQGKNEIVELLKEDHEGWKILDKLRPSNESESDFFTRIKKQIRNVLFEDKYKELVNQSNGNGIVSIDEKPPAKKKKVELPKEGSETVDKQNDELEIVSKEQGSINKVIENSDNDVKPKNILSFVLAEVPKVEETIEIEDEAAEKEGGSKDISKDQIDTEDIIQTAQMMKLDQDKVCVLVFHIKKEISHKDCKNFFLSSENQFNVAKVQRTVTNDDKYRGVYLLTFVNEEASQDFLSLDIELNGVRLDTTSLFSYKREKYFKNQIIKARAFKANNDILLKHLQEEKKANKLENCAVIQVDAIEEEVLEYFCGLESQFAEDTDEAVEEVKVMESPKIPQYILVLKTPEAALNFLKSPQYHIINESEVKVTLMTDRMKLIRYGQKIKNFVDNDLFSPSDNQRRIVVTSIKRDIPTEQVTSFLETAFPKQINIHRCQIDQFFFGVYVISFNTNEEAMGATSVQLNGSDITVNPLIMLLSEYCLQRETYLQMKHMVRRKRISNQEEDQWKNQFNNIEKLHEEHWGKMENEQSFNNTDDNTGDESDSTEDDTGYNPLKMLRSNIHQ